MRFRVSRTSQFLKEPGEPPMGGCSKSVGHVGHMRDGMLIVKEQEGWFLEISSLEDLMEFCVASGSDIILSAPYNGCEPTLEIYDGYRE